jgi:hypothetical protein
MSAVARFTSSSVKLSTTWAQRVKTVFAGTDLGTRADPNPNAYMMFCPSRGSARRTGWTEASVARASSSSARMDQKGNSERSLSSAVARAA